MILSLFSLEQILLLPSDIETLQKTQNDLVETIQETLRIQKEGKEKRRAAEVELGHLEEDLKDRLLDLTSNK